MRAFFLAYNSCTFISTNGRRVLIAYISRHSPGIVQVKAEGTGGSRQKIEEARICSEIGILKSTLSMLIKQRAKLEELNNVILMRKRARTSKHCEIDEADLIWFKQGIQMNGPVKETKATAFYVLSTCTMYMYIYMYVIFGFDVYVYVHFYVLYQVYTL